MENNDTKILIDNDESKRSDVTKDDGVDSNQAFIAKLRHYNRQGPHIVYGSTPAVNRKPKPVRRLIRKSGKYNVSRSAKSEVWDKYLRDFSHTLVNSRWRWTIIASTSSFIISWLLFGVIWMLIANANGDVDLKSPSTAPCLSGIQGFAGYFLFSLESQATIGYGSRYISHHCPEAVFILCLQIIMGCAICGLMVNIVYLKMMKPLKKYSKRLFSKHAVICRRDGELCLIFRVRDEDAKHAVSTVVNAYILRKKEASEEPCLETLTIEPHGFLIWPLEIVHKITSTSPLWDISSFDLITDRFELIVQLQGASPTTGQCTKTRTSYLSSEILWGHSFTRCVKYAFQERAYVISHKDFNVTQEHLVHLCSAKRFAEVFQYINPSSAPPPQTFHSKKIEINIVHSNRMTYMPAQSIDKSEHSSLANKRDSVCGHVEDNTPGEDSEKRHSQYEGVTPDEVDETSKLLPKFNFTDVTLSESSTSLVRPVPPSYGFVSQVLRPSSLRLAIPRASEKEPPTSSADISPGYDNVSMETDPSISKTPLPIDVPQVADVASKFGSRSRINSSSLTLPPVPTFKFQHVKDVAPSAPGEVSPETERAAGVTKFGQHPEAPRNNDLTLPFIPMPQFKSYHQFQNVKDVVDEVPPEIDRAADGNPHQEAPRNSSTVPFVPVPQFKSYHQFQNVKDVVDEVPPEIDRAADGNPHQEAPRNSSTLPVPKFKSYHHFQHVKEGVGEAPPKIDRAGDISKFDSYQKAPRNDSVPALPKSKSYHQFQQAKEYPSSQIGFSSSGALNLSTKTNVSSEEIMDLDVILAYLEEYLEKNGEIDGA